MTRFIRPWYAALADYETASTDYVLATVLATTGSAPREAGTKMLIGQADHFDTLGGGQLEQLVIAQARGMLAEQRGGQVIQHFPLAAAAMQCCGGSVTVLFECKIHQQLRVVLFGAGYVGAQVKQLLEGLQASVTWLDNRRQIESTQAGTYEYCPDPVAWVAAGEAAGEESGPEHALIMTHDHLLDFALVEALLKRGCTSIGLIGSTTKANNFLQRLTRNGWTPVQLKALRCPLGISGIQRKDPPAVALSIVAELMQLAGPVPPAHSTTWRKVGLSLVQQPQSSQILPAAVLSFTSTGKSE
ncbi:MAG: xanthine dehydrogenase accessory protein XdhC [Pseudomonadota bacterium]